MGFSNLSCGTLAEGTVITTYQIIWNGRFSDHDRRRRDQIDHNRCDFKQNNDCTSHGFVPLTCHLTRVIVELNCWSTGYRVRRWQRCCQYYKTMKKNYQQRPAFDKHHGRNIIVCHSKTGDFGTSIMLLIMQYRIWHRENKDGWRRQVCVLEAGIGFEPTWYRFAICCIAFLPPSHLFKTLSCAQLSATTLGNRRHTLRIIRCKLPWSRKTAV